MALTERDLNITRKAPQAQKTPTQSKLPRLVPTPNSAPAATKWSTNVADRVASVEKTAKEMNKAYEPNGRRSAIYNRKSQQSMFTPANKPLPGEKPLPSRPIARLSYSLSPSKDGRTLLDASEEPLHFTSATGEKYQWPSLTPQSTKSASATPDSELMDRSTSDVYSNDHAAIVTRASLMAAASTLTDVITGKASGKENRSPAGSESSDSSYTSAVQSDSPTRPLKRNSSLNVRKSRDTDTMSLCGDNKPADQDMDFPARQASLRSRISDGSLVSPSGGSSHKFVGFTDFTKVRAVSPTSTDSRQHTPSPASFSRLRPGSISTTNSRALKTASRIPVPETKKAQVVDVKRDRSPKPSTSSPAIAPTFGSRRLASPEALRILEEGKMRRQLKRMGPDATVAGIRLVRTDTVRGNTNVSDSDMPSLSHSVDTSPEGTLAPNSPMACATRPSFEDMEAASAGQDNDLGDEKKYGVTTSQHLQEPPEHDNSESEHIQTYLPVPVRPPPSTSPYTMPLQTIPSQAVLPTQDDWNQDEPSIELNRTLSHLEGKGSPPKTDVDQHILLSMFGHLRRGRESKDLNSATLAENAAAAEKYLAQNPSVRVEDHANSKNKIKAHGNRKSSGASMKDEAQRPSQGKRKTTMISKWSDTTPSDKDMSPTNDRVSAGQVRPSIQLRQSTTESKEVSNDAISVGHPSLVPTRVSISTDRPSNDSPEAPAVSRRQSSPTLGQQKQPGSVRAAREGIQGSNASFARPTLSAESKRTTKVPRPKTKTSPIPETPPRGRRSLGGRARQTNGVSPKEPRSRSKSRYVLDKINGLFSGKHDRKSEGVPPLPKIDETKLQPRTTMNSYKVKISADGSPRQASQLPKMPSFTASTQTLNNASTTTTKTEETGPLDSSSDSQSVQNLAEHILGKAQRETNPHRKERLLNFAKVLNDSLISAREAQISAETAGQAAKSAQMSYEMTQQSLAMLQRLASAMVRKGGCL